MTGILLALGLIATVAGAAQAGHEDACGEPQLEAGAETNHYPYLDVESDTWYNGDCVGASVGADSILWGCGDPWDETVEGPGGVSVHVQPFQGSDCATGVQVTG